MVGAAYGAGLAAALVLGAIAGYLVGRRHSPAAGLERRYAEYLDRILAAFIEDLANLAVALPRSSDGYQQARAMATAFSLMRQNTAEVLYQNARPIRDTPEGTDEGANESGGATAPALLAGTGDDRGRNATGTG